MLSAIVHHHPAKTIQQNARVTIIVLSANAIQNNARSKHLLDK
jgi:hypothetical protein